MRRGLAPHNDLTRFARPWQYLKAHQTHNWQAIDDFAQKKLVHELRFGSSRFVFAVYPGVDEYSHLTDPFSDKTKNAYKNFDAHLGAIFSELQKRGEDQTTLVFVVSDHGHGVVREHFDVGPWLHRHLKFKTFYYTNIFKFRFDAVSMVSGNGMAHLYFKGQNGWAGRLLFEELKSQNLLLDELRLHPLVDFIVCAGGEDRFHILSAAGVAQLSYNAAGQTFQYAYRGEDPLKVFAKSRDTAHQTFSLAESLSLTFAGAYPDAFWQMVQIFQSPRTGDIVVLSKPGADLRQKFERYEHHSGHGGLQREHMLVPLLSNAPLTSGCFRSVDVFPTLLTLLGETIPAGCEGKPIPLR